MKVLMVGCGAVGQVFGFYLQKTSVEVCYYARPKSAERLIQAREVGGLPIFRISHFRRRGTIPHRLPDYQVVTDIKESLDFKPDQIWFTTPSTVFYTPWFHEFLNRVPSKRVVCFAPEGGRHEFYPESGDANRLVFGGITFIAWQGDLDGGGGLPEAVNYWLPPFLEIPLMGEENACNEVAELLRKGGFRPAIKTADFKKIQSSTSALMSSFVAGLELSGWSFRTYRNSPCLKIAALSSREAVFSQLSGKGSITRALLGMISSPVGFYLACIFLPLLFPFHLEKYLKFHYQKTRDQTLSLLEVYIRDGKKGDEPVENIQNLLKGLRDSA